MGMPVVPGCCTCHASATLTASLVQRFGTCQRPVLAFLDIHRAAAHATPTNPPGTAVLCLHQHIPPCSCRGLALRPLAPDTKDMTALQHLERHRTLGLQLGIKLHQLKTPGADQHKIMANIKQLLDRCVWARLCNSVHPDKQWGPCGLFGLGVSTHSKPCASSRCMHTVCCGATLLFHNG